MAVDTPKGAEQQRILRKAPGGTIADLFNTGGNFATDDSPVFLFFGPGHGYIQCVGKGGDPVGLFRADIYFGASGSRDDINAGAAFDDAAVDRRTRRSPGIQ